MNLKTLLKKGPSYFLTLARSWNKCTLTLNGLIMKFVLTYSGCLESVWTLSELFLDPVLTLFIGMESHQTLSEPSLENVWTLMCLDHVRTLSSFLVAVLTLS